MRRLTSFTTVGAVLLLATGCRPRDNIRPEPTEEALKLKTLVHMADPEAARQLISGFHAVEQNSWRWTTGRFAVLLPRPATSGAAPLVRVRLSVPAAVLGQTGPITFTAASRGTILGSRRWTEAGEYTFEAPIPAAAFLSDTVTVDFTLDRFLPAGKAETRELGVIISGVEIV